MLLSTWSGIPPHLQFPSVLTDYSYRIDTNGLMCSDQKGEVRRALSLYNMAVNSSPFVIVPYLEKASSRDSSVVSKLRPPIKSFPSSNMVVLWENEYN